LQGQFREFLAEWQKLYQLNSQYKLIVVDMRSFFSALKLWLDQVEMNLRVTSAGDTTALENEITDQVAAEVVPCVNELFARLESVAAALPATVLPAHRSYLRAQMHPLVLCSPFSYRTFAKPLGYAGDYEMVNMIARNRPEGGSLYAKVVNTWFIRQPPAEAHRNRLQYLEAKLVEETLRQVRAGRPARILNLACGPAHEVREFIAHQAVAEQAELTMLDFNGETLRHLQAAVAEVCRRSGRRVRVSYVEKSVFQLLKDSARRKSTASDGHFDYVYCAGLFDYLKDDVCAQLTGLMYRWLAPGGLLVLTNVESGNPLRHGMDHLLDWPLEYRDGPQMLKLKPETVAPEDVRVWSDVTGVNVFMEIRKPA
jgi:extracellular factor (EF) 3-hydroxypalmitic acid methyl ester biosynthesis protein